MVNASWQPGGVIGEWQLVRELGRGGMGVVYEAEARDGRRVALKTLLKTATPNARERFRREAEGQARSGAHRNVVRIHSVGLHEDLPYLVTELLSGGTLTERLKRGGRLDPAEAIEVVSALADGLAHAHAQGILHRDVKPANVLFDESGTPKLADFGLAKLPDAQTLTQTGQVMGTVGYLAPEMIDDARRAGPLADVYSLGALLYTCLAGKPPLKAGTQINRILALLRAPAPLLRSERPDAPEALEQICARALERDPAARFPSAASMAEALRALPPEGSPETPRGPGLLLAGLVLSGLLLALALGFALWTPAKVEATPAPSPSASARASGTPEQAGWRVPRRGELRYRVSWEELGFMGVKSRAESVIVLEVSPLDATHRRIEARWEFSDFASIGPDGRRAAFVPPEPLDLAKKIVVFKGDLDLTSGAWEVTQTPQKVHNQIQALVNPNAGSRAHERPDEVTSDANDWIGTWVSCFFESKRLPRLLELLFSREPLERTEIAWGERPGMDRLLADTSGEGVIYPYLWTLPRQYLRDRGNRRRTTAEGERIEKEGLPGSLKITQRVTILDGRFAEDVLEIELLPQR